MTAPPPPACLALRLHTSEDPNGNAFASPCSGSSPSSPSSPSSCSSSSSSSRSSPCPGEASPDSPSSPSDRMLAVAVTTAAAAAAAAARGPEEDGGAAGAWLDDASLSVYLDARSSARTWSDRNLNLLVAIAAETAPGPGRHGNHAGDDLSTGRGGCPSPDSDATEIPADDDDDDDDEDDDDYDEDDADAAGEDESLFLSASSEPSLDASSGTQSRPLSEGPPIPGASCCLLFPATPSPSSSSPSSPSSSTNQLPDSRLSEAAGCEVSLKSAPPQTEPEQPRRGPAMAPTAAKPANHMARMVRRPDLRHIKAKVVSRAAPSAARPSNQRPPANQRRAIPRKEEVHGNGEKGQRWAAGGVKTRTSPCRSVQSEERRSTLANRTLSGSARSELGPEVAEVPTVANGVTMTTPDTPPGQKVSSKLGPGPRQQAGQRAPGASCATGPAAVWGSGAPAQGGSGPRPAQAESSSLGKEAASTGAGAPGRARLSHNQGLLKPRPISERSSSLATQYSVTSNSKAASANQLAGSLPCGRSLTAMLPPSSSKLPVKGLPRSLSSSSLGSSPAQNNKEAPAGSPADEKPGRGAPPLGNHSPANPPGPGTAVSTDANANANNNACNNASTNANSAAASTRAPGIRCRAFSVQNRTNTTGLKPPAVTGSSPARTTNHTAAGHKTAASANPASPAKPSQNPFQRSGSARYNRPTSTISPVWVQQHCLPACQTPVDKNKPRGAPARPIHAGSTPTSTTQPGCTSTQPGCTSTQPGCPLPAGPNHNLNQNLNQQPPAEIQIPDLLNGNGPPCRRPAQTPEVGARAPTPTSTPTSPSTPQGMGVRTGSRPNGRVPPRPAGGPSSGPQAGGGGRRVEEKRSHSKEQVEEKRLRRLLVQGNRRVEALATVIQHLLSEREMVLKQKQNLSNQLTDLKEELASSTLSCEQLQKEKEEALCSQQEALCSAQEQQKEELGQLEDRLRSFYQAEWDKVHQRYQEEADRFRALMEQQVEELRSRQEAELREQEVTHSQEAESMTQRFEASVQDLQSSHQENINQLDRRLQETEASLSERVSVLLQEKEELEEKLRAEEEATRRSLTEPRYLYLQQELDSLKVVLEMKTSQLHLKDKKLMEMEKLVDTNAKLEEYMNRVRQENEDYRARMSKHAALSKQLTSEQALLQKNLQKESKVNKRLSMENEELLWKLHHGDPLGSPRQLSPTSPCHSPPNSPHFPTAPPLSPR
ncbi:microtubule-associated tumor suppressor candidate 2 homolog isoform X3 [Gadus morhua]|nr:microtubule-associated tumor suppressor candidate 2 homolog isoform X3 [Gadus morhua]